MREYIQCRRVIAVFLLLAVIVVMRMIVALDVEKYSESNSFLSYLASRTPIQTQKDSGNWEEKYPHRQNRLQNREKTISQKQKRIEAFCTTGFPMSDEINCFVSYYQSNVLTCEIAQDAGEYGHALYVEEAIENVRGLNEFCKARNIFFSFIATPTNDSILYYNGVYEGIENWNIVNRSKALVMGLEKNNVDCMVIAKEAVMDGHFFTFDESKHWYTRDALYATRKIADRMNSISDFQFELSDFSEEKYKNYLEQFPEIKDTIQINTDYEYEFLVPLKSGDYELSYAERGIQYEGTFQDTFFRSQDQWNLEGGAYHNMTNITNSVLYNITNRTSPCNQDKAILIIGDSFNWPIAGYLSQGVSKLAVIHNASFDGSIESYIESFQPDAVLVIYNDAEYFDVFTSDAFDFR